MNQVLQQLLALVLAIISASIMMPSQAQNLRELTNDNTNKSNTIESLGVIDAAVPSQLNDSSTAANSKADLSSEEASNSAASAKVPTTNSNVRIPITSRIFVVPSMQQ